MIKRLMLVTFLVGASQSVLAQSPSNAAGATVHFDSIKQKIISNIDERIEGLNQTKACVSAAQNKDGLKACRDQAKMNRDKFKDVMKTNRMQNMEQKMQRMQNSKNKK